MTAKTSLRFLISSEEGGIIIGPNGRNIKQLHKQFCAIINISGTSSNERILSITTPNIDSLLQPLEEILALIFLSDNSDLAGVGWLLEKAQIEHLLTHEVYKIDKILENTRTEMDIFRSMCPSSSESVVKIKGSPDAVAKCILQDIYPLLLNCNVQTICKPYNPDNANEAICKDYGGFCKSTMKELQNRVSSKSIVHKYPSRYNYCKVSTGNRKCYIFPIRLIDVLLGKGGERIREVASQTEILVELEAVEDYRAEESFMLILYGSIHQIQQARSHIDMWLSNPL